jgi:TatD DNase family protein
MRFVDAHIHLSDEEYADCIDEIIVDAKNANVVAMVSSSMDLKTSKGSVKLAQKHQGTVFAALGIHPWVVQSLTDDELQQTLEYVLSQKDNEALVAIGEIGLDFKYEKVMDKQVKVFDEMLRLAERLDLPVVVHSRGMTEKIIEMLPSYKIRRVLLHWFSNPVSALPKAIEKGYYISEGPVAVYSNGIRDVVRKVPLTNLMTETDGPVRYFKMPFNGKRTTPAFIPTVVNAIAEVKNVDSDDIARQLVSNFETFFDVKLDSAD